MTVKEASNRFKIDEKEIRKLCKAKMIPDAFKDEYRYSIPDSTVVILTSKQICSILIHIIKYRNNTGHLLPESLTNIQSKSIILDYLCKLGFTTFVGERNIDNLKVTDDGFDIILSRLHADDSQLTLNLISFSPQIGLINI